MKNKPANKVARVGAKAESNGKEPRLSQGASHPAQSKGPLFQLRNVLVPVDFSDCSDKALRYAIHFARQFGAEVTLLHVIAPVVLFSAGEVPAQGILESTDAARQSLEELQCRMGGDIRCTILVRRGSPHVEIIDAAKETGTDLIILSTHGRTGLEHVLMGSTAEKVIRRASCPVLIVRQHEHEFINVIDLAEGDTAQT